MKNHQTAQAKTRPANTGYPSQDRMTLRSPDLLILSLLTPLALVGLAGCGGGSSNNDPQTTNLPSNTPPVVMSSIIELQVDATAGGVGAAASDPKNRYTYLNLDSGQVVALSDVEATTSSDWHVAFKRSNVKLNGGVSGPGSVKGALADDQAEFYNTDGTPNTSVLLAATAQTTLADFNAVSAVASLSYQSDRTIPAILGDGTAESWWAYNATTHAVSANTGNWWLVKSAGGDSYAKLHVTNLVKTGTVSRDLTLELFVQGVGQSAFSATATAVTLNIPYAGGAKCYDFDAGAEADCAGVAWDLKAEYANQSYNLWTNGGVSTATGGKGAAFGKIAPADIAAYADGTHDAGGSDISALYTADKAGGVFVDKSWYAYGFLPGDHKLYPNYRTYALDTGSAKYKLQLLSYYDAAGTSAMLKLRYAPVAAQVTAVNVTLKEWTITADRSTAPAGYVKFKVSNSGTMLHEMVLLKTDIAADALPTSGGKVDETAAGVEVIGEVEEFAATGVQEAAFDLAPGKYVLVCNIVGHHGQGMRLAFTVQ